MRYLVLIMVLALTLTSCSLKKVTTSMTAKIVSDGMIAVESEPDLWIAKESVVPMVKLLEVFNSGDPNNKYSNALMAKVYGNLAFGFFEPEMMRTGEKDSGVWRDRVVRYYTLGSDAGMRTCDKKFGKRIDGVKKAGKKDMSLLFWTAFDMGNLINLKKDDINLVANLPRVEAMIDRILELDANYAYGSALAFKATLLASRPTMMGGNPEGSKDIFEKAIAASNGKYLMTKVLYAEWYAIPQGNKTLAKNLLNEVIAGDTNAIPEQALANNLAKERAGLLLKTIGSGRL